MCTAWFFFLNHGANSYPSFQAGFGHRKKPLAPSELSQWVWISVIQISLLWTVILPPLQVAYLLSPLTSSLSTSFCFFFFSSWAIPPPMVCFHCSLHNSYQLSLGKLVLADIHDSLPKSSLAWARMLTFSFLNCAWSLSYLPFILLVGILIKMKDK